MEINYAIRWIVIYPVDSAIQLLNNLGLNITFSFLKFNIALAGAQNGLW